MSYKVVNISVDLVQSSLYMQDFLELIDMENFSTSKIQKAIYRYENHWLPLCRHLLEQGKNLTNFYPPLDVAWIWHCHLLSPTHYKIDMTKKLGMLLPHACIKYTDIFDKIENTKLVWQNETGLSFDYKEKKSVDDSFKEFSSKLSYDLYEAVKRQKNFYYQVNLPHFRSPMFLRKALERYINFLFLKYKNPDTFLVPCYAIDIMWHTHQLHPVEYSFDCEVMFEKIFPHDDTVNDRSHGSKLVTSYSETQRLWSKAFGEDFFFAGGMYRGPPPDQHEYTNSINLDLTRHFNRTGKILIEELTLTNIKNEKRVYILNIWNQNMNIIKDQGFIGIYKTTSFIEFDESDLNFRLFLKLNEQLGDKILNVLSTAHRSHPNNTIAINLSLIVPENEQVTTEIKFDVPFKSMCCIAYLKYTLFNTNKKKCHFK